MELADYLKMMSKGWKSILTYVAILGVVAGVWAYLQPAKYQASATIVVAKKNNITQKTINYYQYDEYYAIQASGYFSESLASLMASPGTVKEIYDRAGYPLTDLSLQALTKAIKVRRVPPVSIEMVMVSTDKVRAEKIIETAIIVASEKTEAQRRNDDPNDAFVAVTGNVVTGFAKPSVIVNGIIGMIGGLILGMIVVFMNHYTKKS